MPWHPVGPPRQPRCCRSLRNPDVLFCELTRQPYAARRPFPLARLSTDSMASLRSSDAASVTVFTEVKMFLLECFACACFNRENQGTFAPIALDGQASNFPDAGPPVTHAHRHFPRERMEATPALPGAASALGLVPIWQLALARAERFREWPRLTKLALPVPLRRADTRFITGERRRKCAFALFVRCCWP